MSITSIGVIGAGAIGKAHAELIARSGVCRLAGIADPAAQAADLASQLSTSYHADYRSLLDVDGLDGVIIATPNDTHLSVALAAIERGLPAIVEKPIAVTVAEGEAMTRASEASGIPILVGHHRRYNPIIRTARKLIADGAIGDLTAATVIATFRKPDDYFDLAWRRGPGGGPVLINLIHEIDLIRHVCGEVASVQALTSNARRGFEVEDTAAVLLRLVNGALVTVTLSDATVSPWSWDLVSGELAPYPAQPRQVQTHFMAGSEGSLTLPTLDLWTYEGRKSWYLPLTCTTQPVERGDPYIEQLRHFCRVIRKEEAPIITAADATRTLRATLAVREAASTGGIISLT